MHKIQNNRLEVKSAKVTEAAAAFSYGRSHFPQRRGRERRKTFPPFFARKTLSGGGATSDTSGFRYMTSTISKTLVTTKHLLSALTVS